MELLLQIAAIAALVAICVLVVFAVVSLVSLTKLLKETDVSMKSISSDFSQLKESTIIMLGELSKTNEKVVESLDNLNGAIKDIRFSANQIERRTDSLFNILEPFGDLFKYAYKKIAPPVSQTALYFSAASKAISAFTTIISTKKKS